MMDENCGMVKKRSLVDGLGGSLNERAFPRICIWEAEGEAGDITCDIIDNVEASMFCRDGTGFDCHGIRKFQRSPCCLNGEVKKLGQTISKGHKNYDLMLNLQLDIRCLLRCFQVTTNMFVDDKAAPEAVANVFRAAEAVGEFSGMLVSLRMAIDDSTGLGGENVKPLTEEFVNALRTVYQRYTKYLDAFGPDETYLRKKVETELGTKMIHLKMRCSGIGSEWGKVTVLGTSGLSGSYVEHRA
ncbi:hypothetical protein LOK49_LG08G00816 [Camellia lanceoleosa]|uniref:Uncharacterized protein n=1 Tax=Camellia lanceoleosa TaxID=1840588 RepID=A0ACC0GV18_9ERIC|nr:hypothetical protein LOK49_LG08G00816 [Camellia lanceoleosa]